MMLMLMECPSHIGTLHVNTSGHMLLVLTIMHSTMVHTIAHVNKTLLMSLHHMLVLTATVSLVLTSAALHYIYSTTMTHCGMDSSVVVLKFPAAHTPTCCGSS